MKPSRRTDNGVLPKALSMHLERLTASPTGPVARLGISAPRRTKHAYLNSFRGREVRPIEQLAGHGQRTV